MLKTTFFLSSFLLLAGCRGEANDLSQTQAVATLSAKPEPTKSKPKTEFDWKLDDAGWKLERIRPGTVEKPRINAVYTSTTEEGVSTIAFVATAKLTTDEETTFLEDVKESAHDRENAHVVGEKYLKLKDGRKAYEVMEARQEEQGLAAVITLATSRSGIGYVVSCGGNAEDVEVVIPKCLRLVESLEFTK